MSEKEKEFVRSKKNKSLAFQTPYFHSTLLPLIQDNSVLVEMFSICLPYFICKNSYTTTYLSASEFLLDELAF